eukprot:Gb_00120 [translate_table: standard]
MGVAWSCWEWLERFDPHRSIAIGSSCIWDKFIFLATGRPGHCMEMLLECLRNPRYRLGIVTVCSSVCKLVLKSMAVVYCEHYEECDPGSSDASIADDAQGNSNRHEQSQRYKINGDSAWPLAPVWPEVRNSTFDC